MQLIKKYILFKINKFFINGMATRPGKSVMLYSLNYENGNRRSSIYIFDIRNLLEKVELFSCKRHFLILSSYLKKNQGHLSKPT